MVYGGGCLASSDERDVRCIGVFLRLAVWFEETVAWGARPHLFRAGGPTVNSGPLVHSPRMSLRVPGLWRLNAAAAWADESLAVPTHVGGYGREEAREP
jgi:hypothetical protein